MALSSDPTYSLLEQRSRGILAAVFAELAFAPHPWGPPEWERVYVAVHRIISLFMQFKADYDNERPKEMTPVLLRWAYGTDGQGQAGMCGSEENKARSEDNGRSYGKALASFGVKLTTNHLFHSGGEAPLRVEVFMRNESVPKGPLKSFLKPELQLQLQLERMHETFWARPNACLEPPRAEEKLWDLRVRFSDFLRRFLEHYRREGSGSISPFHVFFLGSRALDGSELGAASHVHSGIFGHSYLLDEGQKAWFESEGEESQRAFVASNAFRQESVQFPEGKCSEVFVSARPTTPAVTDEIIASYASGGRTSKDLVSFEQSIIEHSLLEIPVYQDLGMTKRELAPDGTSLIMCINLPEGSGGKGAPSSKIGSADSAGGRRVGELCAVPKDTAYEMGEAQFVTEMGQRLVSEYLRAGALRISARAHKIAEDLVGESPAMNQIRKDIVRFASSELNVVILGETGTGKELVARALHDHSNRTESAFVAINCGAIGEDMWTSELFGHKKGSYTGAMEDRLGAILTANGGTLFLDEIADLPMEMQRRLLRTLDSGEVSGLGFDGTKKSDFRLVCATNGNLEDLVGKGQMRDDFYRRIMVGRFEVPPLRERRGDPELLAGHVLFNAGTKEQRGRRIEMDEEFLELIREHEWPGNFRELQTLIMNARLLCLESNEVKLTTKHFLQCVGKELEQHDTDGLPQLHRALPGFYRVVLERVDESGDS